MVCNKKNTPGEGAEAAPPESEPDQQSTNQDSSIPDTTVDPGPGTSITEGWKGGSTREATELRED